LGTQNYAESCSIELSRLVG